MRSDESWRRLRGLVVDAFRDNAPMTPRQIVRAIDRRAHVKTDVRSVRLVLRAGGFAPARSRFKWLPGVQRWRLVEAGPGRDEGTSGAPVPAVPRRPLLSGGAAVTLTLREDDPPSNAIGRPIR